MRMWWTWTLVGFLWGGEEYQLWGEFDPEETCYGFDSGATTFIFPFIVRQWLG